MDSAVPVNDTSVAPDRTVKLAPEDLEKLQDAVAETLGDRYEVLSRLSSGSLADVYHARDKMLDREVAIKRVRLNGLTNPNNRDEAKKRFLREAKVAARLNHPNIVTIYDIVDSATVSFFVMEFIDGTTLEAVLEEKNRMSWEETLHILTQAADALEYAHQGTVVHRDIKPSNIIIERSGRVKVADFGIAKSETSGNITTTGTILGTPNYMSPEQARGNRKIDGRADIFSLGCILYECLSGNKPFQASSTIGILMRIVGDDMPELDCEKLGLDSKVGEVLRRALAKNPDERIATGGEFLEALQSIPSSLSASVDHETPEETKELEEQVEASEKPDAAAEEPELAEESVSFDASAESVDSEDTPEEKEGEQHRAGDAREDKEHEKAEETQDVEEVEAPAPKPITRRDEGSEPAYDNALQGTLDQKDLAHVIREVYVNRRTGILHLVHENVNKRIYFKKGSIVFANSDLNDDRLGEFLIKHNVIDRSAFDGAVKSIKDTGHRLGAALVDLGHLSEEKLNEQVTEQIKSIIFSVFEWEAGQFAFERLETPVEEDIIVGLSTADTILEGIRRMKSMETIRQALGQLDRVLAHPENPLLMYQKFSLTPEEGFVMSRVDGTTTVTEAAALSPMGEEDTLRCIYGLVCAGVLTLEERAQERNDRMKRSTKADEAKLPSPEAEIKEQPAKTTPVAVKEKKDSGPTPEQQSVKDEIAAKHASLATANHYELLEIEATADEARIKEAYYAMVKKYHPDRHHSPHFEDLHGLLEDLMVKVTAAYQLLSKPADRMQYDTTLRSNGASSSGPSPFVDDPDVTKTTPEEIAEKHYREGNRLFNEMAYFDAIQCLQEAVRLNANKASYHKLLGKSLSKNPNWRKDAESHFLKSLELDASDVECYVGLAVIYDELGLSARLQNTWRKILELEPDNEVAYAKVHGKKKSGGLMGLLRKRA